MQNTKNHNRASFYITALILLSVAHGANFTPPLRAIQAPLPAQPMAINPPRGLPVSQALAQAPHAQTPQSLNAALQQARQEVQKIPQSHGNERAMQNALQALLNTTQQTLPFCMNTTQRLLQSQPQQPQPQLINVIKALEELEGAHLFLASTLSALIQVHASGQGLTSINYQQLRAECQSHMQRIKRQKATIQAAQPSFWQSNPALKDITSLSFNLATTLELALGYMNQLLQVYQQFAHHTHAISTTSQQLTKAQAGSEFTTAAAQWIKESQLATQFIQKSLTSPHIQIIQQALNACNLINKYIHSLQVNQNIPNKVQFSEFVKQQIIPLQSNVAAQLGGSNAQRSLAERLAYHLFSHVYNMLPGLMNRFPAPLNRPVHYSPAGQYMGGSTGM